MAKTLKPNLDKDELNTLYKANLAYAKNTHEHYFKFKKDLDYKIFKTTQAEIPNIFSVWDECFSFVRNYKNLMSKTNLGFLYTI
ncbi:hypothetical protein VN1340_10490 [Helicobacter pylori]